VSRIALPDVNVLIALFDPDHVHHETAHGWFEDQKADGWATCATTEIGFVRVLSNPAYGSPVNPGDLVSRLDAFRKSGHHRFLPQNVSLTDDTLFKRAFIRGHRQLTDIFLLGMAARAGVALATFDRTIPLAAAKGATRSRLFGHCAGLTTGWRPATATSRTARPFRHPDRSSS
jgi:toxin-antitoxin system PIN domain toxin